MCMVPNPVATKVIVVLGIVLIFCFLYQIIYFSFFHYINTAVGRLVLLHFYKMFITLIM